MGCDEHGGRLKFVCVDSEPFSNQVATDRGLDVEVGATMRADGGVALLYPSSNG